MHEYNLLSRINQNIQLLISLLKSFHIYNSEFSARLYLYPVKVLSSNGSGDWSWLIAALDWIMDKKGARIASMSLGGGGAPQALANICEAGPL